jgi:hypothetical protein
MIVNSFIAAGQFFCFTKSLARFSRAGRNCGSSSSAWSSVSFPISCESAILMECYSYLVRKSDLAVAETGTVFDFSVQQAGKTFSR